MKTLKTLVEHTRCRKGPAFGTTKSGAFWLAIPPIRIRSYGGDGIGQSSAAVTHELQLRYFRDGTIQAVVRYQSWHQNSDTTETFTCVDILNLNTVEEVVIALKRIEIKADEEYAWDVSPRTNAYSDQYRKHLEVALINLGMSLAAPAPDEIGQVAVTRQNAEPYGGPHHSVPAKVKSGLNEIPFIARSIAETGNLPG